MVVDSRGSSISVAVAVPDFLACKECPGLEQLRFIDAGQLPPSKVPQGAAPPAGDANAKQGDEHNLCGVG